MKLERPKNGKSVISHIVRNDGFICILFVAKHFGG
jgi:hypothetical protein